MLACPSGEESPSRRSVVSTYELPIVDDFVDGVVGMAEDNPLYRLPLIGSLLKAVVELCLDAAAFFAAALTLGGGLYYMWPSIAALAPRHLGTLSGYWAYVVAVLAGFFVVTCFDWVRSRRTADVLREEERSSALEDLSGPGMLIMLVWLITTYIS